MTLYDDEATRWLCVNTHIYMYIMILWWWVVMRTRWWLRSTTGLYGRLVIEIAYREMILSLHRGRVGDDSLGRVVRVSAWCITYVWHIRINTNVGSVYIYIDFQHIKIYVYVYGFKNLYVVWWTLTLSWPDEDQRIFSIAHEFLNVKLKPQIVLWWFYTKSYNFTLWHLVDIKIGRASCRERV